MNREQLVRSDWAVDSQITVRVRRGEVQVVHGSPTGGAR